MPFFPDGILDRLSRLACQCGWDQASLKGFRSKPKEGIFFNNTVDELAYWFAVHAFLASVSCNSTC